MRPARSSAPTGATARRDTRGLRLQVIISRSGLASRREAERLILDGEVSVNGKVVTELGTRADPLRDHVKLGGRLLHGNKRPEYWLFHKPGGVVTTMSDPQGRPSVGDAIGPTRRHLFPVGRLDFHSSGILVLTNDGELCERLTHPRYHIAKKYRVKISRAPGDEALWALRNGVRLSDGDTGPAWVRVERQAGGKAWLDITINEGRNRQVRRMLDAVGLRVEKLRRTSIGPLRLGLLPAGHARRLTMTELDELKRAVRL